MFKQLIVYRIAPESVLPDAAALDEALAKMVFMGCGATQEKSVGWIPPRGEEHGALVESVGGQWILRLMVESKTVPASVLKKRVEEMAKRIEQETGRKPGKKESQEMKDEAKLDLLPMAFTKERSTWVWIDPKARFLVMDAGAQSAADEIAALLVEVIPGLSIALLNTKSSPQAAMAHWLKEQEPPVGFTIDRECELKSSDESKQVVRYGHHPLDIDEVRAHIEAGKLPVKLAMTWDGRLSFLLTERLQIKKLSFLDGVFEGEKKGDGGFDADVAIATGELSKLLPDVIAALGSEGTESASGEGEKREVVEEATA